MLMKFQASTIYFFHFNSCQQRTHLWNHSTTTVTWCGGMRDVSGWLTPTVTWWQASRSSRPSCTQRTTATWRTSWCRWAGLHLVWFHQVFCYCESELCFFFGFYRKPLKTLTRMGMASSTCRSTLVRRWGHRALPGCVSTRGLQPSKPVFEGQCGNQTVQRPVWIQEWRML